MYNGPDYQLEHLENYYKKICSRVAQAQARRDPEAMYEHLRIVFALENIARYEGTYNLEPKETYINEELERIRNERDSNNELILPQNPKLILP